MQGGLLITLRIISTNYADLLAFGAARGNHPSIQ